MKKILIASDTWYGSTGYSVEQAFRRRGWNVQVINPSSYLNICNSIWMKVANRITRRYAINDYNRSIQNKINSFLPDVFLTIKGVYLNPRTISLMNDARIKTVNYYPDYHFSYKSFDKDTIPYYQYFVTTKSFQVDYLKQVTSITKVYYLPHGYSDDAHFIENNSKPQHYDNDLLYIGSFEKEKKFWLESVKKRFPNIKMTIYGNGWLNNTYNSILKESVFGDAIYGRDYCNAINKAKINLAVHMGANGSRGWKDLVSTRTFEIPACKGFMLHANNDEISEFFEPENEIAVFHSEKELHDKIEFYLSNDSIREGMIDNAYKRCVPDYGYDARVKSIEAYLSAG